MQSLLKPRGTLILLEDARRRRWIDLTFGLTEGWWRFADHALRADHPLLYGEQWRRLLHRIGFAQAASLLHPQLGEGIMLARADATASAVEGHSPSP